MAHLISREHRATSRLAQVTSLVSMGLLSRTGAAADLSSLKFRCNVTAATAQNVAQSLRLNLHKFMHEALAN